MDNDSSTAATSTLMLQAGNKHAKTIRSDTPVCLRVYEDMQETADTKKGESMAFSLLELVGRAGFEPATNWLKANCSTN